MHYLCICAILGAMAKRTDPRRPLTWGRFSEYPFCYESHARVRAPADGETSTRSHGATPAQECRLRLKRPPPKAAPWFPPFNSSTPERLRGSCASASSAQWQTERSSFRFGKKNCARGSFTLQNG